MKARGAAVQGALAGAALLAAYFGWQREPARAPNEVVVLDARPSELQAVRFDDGKKWVVLEKEEEAVWLTYGSHPPPANPPALPDGGVVADAGVVGAADAGAPVVEPVPPPRTVRGNDSATALLERFAPLRGTRALGTLDSAKLQELGLHTSPRFLDVTLKSGTQRFVVSAVSPSGGSPYLRSEKDGQVYLIPATLISDLGAASTRLVDRRLHAFRQPDYDEVRLRAGDKERTFVQTGVPPELKVAAKSSPQTPDDFARNWLEKVYRLIPTETLGKEELPEDGAPVVEARAEYLKDGKPLGFIELARAPGNRLYVRTEHTAGWVKVQLGAKEVLDDAARLAGGT